MAISFVGAGTAFSVTTSGTAYQLRCPAGVQDGDILISFLCWEGSATAVNTPMDGWTSIAQVGIDDGTDDWILFIDAKDAVASDASKDYTTAADNGQVDTASTRRSSVVLAYRGTAPVADQTTWVAGNVTQNAGSTGGATQTITNPSSDAWVLAFFGAHDASAGAWSATGDVSSERYTLSNGGADPRIFHEVWDSNGTVAAGGVNATGTPSVTEDNSIVWICCIEPEVVIPPAPVGGGVFVVKQAQVRAHYW